MRHRAQKIFEKLGYRKIMAVGILLTAGMLYAFLTDSVQGDAYDIQLFQLSSETIRSEKTVEDPIKTELERQRLADEVAPSYQFMDEIADNQSALIESLFDYLLDAKAAPEAEQEELSEEDKIAQLREDLRLMETSENGLRLTDDMLRSLLALSDERLIDVREELDNLLQSYLSEPIRIEEVARIRTEIEQDIRRNEQIPANVVQAAVTIGRFGIIANELVNEELTASQVQQVRNSVEPTRILQGQVLVQEGQVVDKEIYRQLELAGMTEEHLNYKPLLGLLIFVLIAVGLLMAVMSRSEKDDKSKSTELLVIVVVIAISLALMKLLYAVSGNFDLVISFIFPTALAGMLVRLLVNERAAVYVTILISAAAGIMLQSGYSASLQVDVALYILFGGLTAIYLIDQDGGRGRLLQISLAVAGVNVLFVAFYLLIGQTQYNWSEIGFYFTAAIVSGLLSGALAIGFLPFFESAFGMLSAMRLIELSNPNHPLLKKILMETPGTYHHSLMVANLADASCEAIGANGLLARVGCYYHDIGKTKQPQFFIENQVNIENPHDRLPPEKSRDIILAHGVQGAQMLKNYKMPKEIIDVAAQHHGTSLLKFFYYKAKETNPDTNEEAYRYVGPKPQTKEIAIICIADSLEAAVRSMKEPTSEKIKKLVDSIVEDKLKDGQFEECDISLKELKTVKSVMCETLNGIFHSRIEYPKETN
ncbi:HDIG domain-containing protein [Planococcus sp. CPCC 101016]|uniref:HD family phosphohydrolase n=1 Tax=Planococcus sp. CPCC 101016 TaxID=2599617 RepID=UPI0011B36247|nr:HDIG domain-containing metalloprotein [Planococcus sp. CPCC 101016]TWT08253.1 HDIG domain-containing protein [Planococcus sp. CPCC 101016]